MTAEAILHFCYLFTAIFGVGVTVIDLLGLLGGGGDGHHSDSSDHSATDHQIDAHHHSADQGQHHHASDHVPLLSVLGYLRMIVYFCLGFGPLGLVAESNGGSLIGGLVWALSGGLIFSIMAKYFFRFQQKDLDSSVQVEDLFLGNARVIVPISNGNMGKVRVQIGQSVAERYALAENSEESFPNDAEVQIVRVTEDCVYVRRVDEPGTAIKQRVPNKISM